VKLPRCPASSLLFVASSSALAPAKNRRLVSSLVLHYTSRPFLTLARQVSRVSFRVVLLLDSLTLSRSPSKKGTYFAPLFSRSCWFQAGCALPAPAIPSRFPNSSLARVPASAISSYSDSDTSCRLPRRHENIYVDMYTSTKSIYLSKGSRKRIKEQRISSAVTSEISARVPNFRP